MLFINTHLNLEVKVLDMMGKNVSSIIKDNSNNLRVDLSTLSNGAYNILILHNEKQYSKRIIKQ